MPNKTCSWGTCNSRSNKEETKRANITFRKFPQPATQKEKCMEWIRRCNRPHEQLHLEKVGHYHFVCSKVRVKIENVFNLIKLQICISPSFVCEAISSVNKQGIEVEPMF